MKAKRKTAVKLPGPPPSSLEEPQSVDAVKTTIAEEAYAQLKTLIFTFSLPPGERYSESEFTSRLNVSRTPLRLALRMMVRDGLMEFVGGHSAWRVRSLNIPYYEDLYDFRIELEALAMRRLRRSVNIPDLSSLKRIWIIPQRQRVTDGELVADLDESFHIGLMALCGNKAMLDAFEDLTQRIRVIRRLDFVASKRVRATYEEHADILRELAAGNVEEAERLIIRHIEFSRNEIRKITLHHVAMAGSDLSSRKG
jgi:DNA-binding GntR family transcriptional regulator